MGISLVFERKCCMHAHAFPFCSFMISLIPALNGLKNALFVRTAVGMANEDGDTRNRTKQRCVIL